MVCSIFICLYLYCFNVENANFENLRATTYNNSSNMSAELLSNEHISLLEVKKAIFNAKQGNVLIIYRQKFFVMLQQFFFSFIEY